MIHLAMLIVSLVIIGLAVMFVIWLIAIIVGSLAESRTEPPVEWWMWLPFIGFVTIAILVNLIVG